MASEQTFSEWYFEYCKARNRTPSMEEVWNAAKPAESKACASVVAGDPAEPKDDSDREYTRPIGYLPAYELGRLHSGHDANLRSAKFGPSPLDGDVPVYLCDAPALRALVAKWRHAAEHLGLEGLASLADCADELESALASPAPSVGEPVAQWQTSASGEGGWMNIDADEVEFCRDKRGYKVRALVLATPPAAPAATEAPSKPFAYYIHIAAEQRGEFVHDLDEALDDLTNCDCKITELFDHATPAPAVGASEREEGFEKYWVARADFDKMSGDLTRAKNLLVRLWDKHPAARAQIEASTGSWFVWGQDRDAPAAVGASVQPAAGALPPVRWWSGVVGSPEKLANLLDGYSEKKESPRRDERVMRAAAKWIREVVASVQPVLASLSDAIDGPRYRLLRRGQHWSVIDGIGNTLRAESLDTAVDAALASSTPTKGGEAS